MAVVECGRCGWTHEVDEELPLEQLEATATRIYAEHLLQDHHTVPHIDEVVSEYIRHLATIVAPTNGAVKK